MNWTRKLTLGGLIAASAFAVGCKDNSRNAQQSEQRGTGGAGVGDRDIGKTEGVLDDREGPLEENKDEEYKREGVGDRDIGKKEGVLDDREGPLEENKDEELKRDVEPGTGGAGVGDSDIGKNDGVLDDGEGPLEENKREGDLNR